MENKQMSIEALSFSDKLRLYAETLPPKAEWDDIISDGGHTVIEHWSGYAEKNLIKAADEIDKLNSIIHNLHKPNEAKEIF